MQFYSEILAQVTSTNANSQFVLAVQDENTLAIAKTLPKGDNSRRRRASVSQSIAKKLMVALFAVMFPLSQASSVLANEIGASNGAASSAVNASRSHNADTPNYVAAAEHAVASINPSFVNPICRNC